MECQIQAEAGFALMMKLVRFRVPAYQRERNPEEDQEYDYHYDFSTEYDTPDPDLPEGTT